MIEKFINLIENQNPRTKRIISISIIAVSEYGLLIAYCIYILGLFKVVVWTLISIAITFIITISLLILHNDDY